MTSTKKLLTSEFIDGVRIDEINNLKTNINIKKLTTVASEIFFYQTWKIFVIYMIQGVYKLD